MSRHHMLPPIIYTPQPRPKKIESRKSRVQIRGASGVKNTTETEETSEAGAAFPTPSKPPIDLFTAVEGSDHKPWSGGRLSAETLKVMLQAQETDQADFS